MSILELNDVHAYYGKIHALKGISLKVEQGEIVTLIGGNGAGKTTTLRTICALMRPSVGSVTFNGEDLSHHKPSSLTAKGIAMVPEGRGVFARMTVLENLEMGAFHRKDKEIAQDIDQIYDLFPRLKERRTQLAGTMSGGEQQMLAMGRAMMSRPSLLLLDEPSMGLAPVLVEAIFSTIVDINSRGTTILLVEQNALMALNIASRGYVLQTGAIVLSDSAKALQQNEMVQKVYLGIE
ncbi:MAG: ABC transporter ATP-binding protein [Candidatus Promineofilum sp.]|nr:ABC transporter ATP-binding protein [Promineifilum sp.]MBP9656649.1 ABC transporter ATP-binding protein [Promineifilum sp.]